MAVEISDTDYRGVCGGGGSSYSIVEIPAARYLLKDRDSHKEEGKQHDRI